MPAYLTTCYHCGKTYRASHTQSRYCSVNCRVAAYRRRNTGEPVSVELEFERIHESLSLLDQVSNRNLWRYREEIDQMIVSLQHLQKRAGQYNPHDWAKQVENS